ncbi:maternal protein exuperantia [Rhagoletis pomonella]|uniref:maternal protein exuperantia n=1 Tax=Rhagoletis pomonella TaxID=28610 RepID=UPI00177C6168|nr:maternal protein exuperantia [Rhagoletis pomonella]XP_036330666.1 maternal protein exuperantia [Rhagoletis pomonella]
MVASTNASQDGVVNTPASAVANGVISNGIINAANASKTLAKGKYTLVGIDIDTTGRRLIDEIVQLAAYTPKDHFEQYIMPYMNLNPAARQRHQVRVISIGFYRMLKSMQTYKIIKSKSEIAALKDFLDWLEALKAKDAASLGVILVYHEERKFIPYMILESLKKYNLLDRFLNTVKSFANGLTLAKANNNESLQHYTLRKLSKVLSAKVHEVNNNASEGEANNNVSSTTGNTEGQILQKPLNKGVPAHERELFDGSASVRAKLAYEVALQLSNEEHKLPLDSTAALENLLAAVQTYAQPIECDLNELQSQNENLERQNSFRPVFLNYFKTTLYHRVRAVKFRIILAEQGYDLQTLNAIWSEKQKNGLIEVLHVIEELKPEDKTELADLFDSYFDPAKTTIKPIVKNNNRRRNRRGVRNVKNEGSNSARPGSEQGAGGDKQAAAGQLPDSTTKSPSPPTGGKPQRGKRNPRSRNNSLRTQPQQSAVETTKVTATATAAN